jgi:hypothetical protein
VTSGKPQTNPFKLEEARESSLSHIGMQISSFSESPLLIEDYDRKVPFKTPPEKSVPHLPKETDHVPLKDDELKKQPLLDLALSTDTSLKIGREDPTLPAAPSPKKAGTEISLPKKFIDVTLDKILPTENPVLQDEKSSAETSETMTTSQEQPDSRRDVIDALRQDMDQVLDLLKNLSNPVSPLPKEILEERPQILLPQWDRVKQYLESTYEAESSVWREFSDFLQNEFLAVGIRLEPRELRSFVDDVTTQDKWARPETVKSWSYALFEQGGLKSTENFLHRARVIPILPRLFGHYIQRLLDQGRARRALQVMMQWVPETPTEEWADIYWDYLPEIWEALGLAPVFWKKEQGPEALFELMKIKPLPK